MTSLSPSLSPPVCPTRPFSHHYHGVSHTDPYQWLTNKEDPATLSYINEENAYGSSYLSSTSDLQNALIDEMKQRMAEDDHSLCYQHGEYTYWKEWQKGKQYPIYKRTKDKYHVTMDEKSPSSSPLPSVPHISLVDLNELCVSFSTSFMGVADFSPSHDGKYILYLSDSVGYRQYRVNIIHVEKLVRGEKDHTYTFPKEIHCGSAALWSPPQQGDTTDNENNFVVLYCVEDAAKRVYRVYSHQMRKDFNEYFQGDNGKEKENETKSDKNENNNNNENDKDKDKDQHIDSVLSSFPLHHSDHLLYEEKDERFSLQLSSPRHNDLVWIDITSCTTSEYKYIQKEGKGKGNGNFVVKTFIPRVSEVQYSCSHWKGQEVIVRINDTHRTFRAVKINLSDGNNKDKWTELIGGNSEISIDEIDVMDDYMVIFDKMNDKVMERLSFVPFPSSSSSSSLSSSYVTSHRHFVSFPEEYFSVWKPLYKNFSPSSSSYLFSFSSFTSPQMVYSFNVNTHKLSVLKEKNVPHYDRTQYSTRRLYCKVRDGEEVPITVLYNHSIQRSLREKNIPSPLYSYGYGAYGFSISPQFRSNVVSLLDRGFVFAIIHIRGGGDKGKPWHDKGRMMYKLNTFYDFIDGTQWLKQNEWMEQNEKDITIDPSKVTIEGRSAGGLLIGATVNLSLSLPTSYPSPSPSHPLCSVAIIGVPFVDVINTMSDPSLPLTVGEYEEWGNPTIKEEFEYMRKYSPYDNLTREEEGPGRTVHYPSICLTTSLHDSQVMYHEPLKYIAKLRSLKSSSSNVSILRCEMNGGHGGAGGRFDHLKEVAYQYAFVIKENKWNFNTMQTSK